MCEPHGALGWACFRSGQGCGDLETGPAVALGTDGPGRGVGGLKLGSGQG